MERFAERGIRRFHQPLPEGRVGVDGEADVEASADISTARAASEIRSDAYEPTMVPGVRAGHRRGGRERVRPLAEPAGPATRLETTPGANLVDRVLPQVPVRQGVLSLPMPLRFT